MTWNYRACRTWIDAENAVWSVREVYYGDDGKVMYWSTEDASPSGDTRHELLRDVQMMLEAFMHPALDLTTLKDIDSEDE
jgi:hypothetical protein